MLKSPKSEKLLGSIFSFHIFFVIIHNDTAMESTELVNEKIPVYFIAKFIF